MEAARVPGGLGMTQWKTDACSRSARDLTGEKRTDAVGARGVSGQAWQETGARSCPERGWEEAPAHWAAAMRASLVTPEAVSSPAGALVPPAHAGEYEW